MWMRLARTWSIIAAQKLSGIMARQSVKWVTALVLPKTAHATWHGTQKIGRLNDRVKKRHRLVLVVTHPIKHGHRRNVQAVKVLGFFDIFIALLSSLHTIPTGIPSCTCKSCKVAGCSAGSVHLVWKNSQRSAEIESASVAMVTPAMSLLSSLSFLGEGS